METGRQLPAEAVDSAGSASITGAVRGNAIQPNVGTVEYCLKKAKETVHCTNRTYKKSMGMMEPTLAQLTEANERAAVALTRLKSPPFDEQGEMAKQSAIKRSRCRWQRRARCYKPSYRSTARCTTCCTASSRRSRLT